MSAKAQGSGVVARGLSVEDGRLHRVPARLASEAAPGTLRVF